MVALGVLSAVLGGLGAAAVYLANVNVTPVVVMAQSVSRGEVLEAAHLGVVEVPSGFEVPTMGEGDLGSLVGQRALSDLPRGSFPQPASVGENPLPAGQSLVGLRLPLGKMPTGEMPPGTRLRIVGLVEGLDANAPAVVASAPQLLDDGASYSLDVQVADGDADLIARLSAVDQVAVIVVGDS